MEVNRNIVILILGIVLLSSCTGDRADQQRQHASDTTSDTATAESFQKTSVEFSGTWVNNKYIDKLKETRSPREAQDAGDISAVMIPDQTEEQAMMIWGFHEGLEGSFRKKGTEYGLATGKPETIDYKISVSDGTLTMAEESFTRIGGLKEYHIVETILFAGSYDLAGRKVELSSNGRIEGIDSLSYYSANLDYMDAGMDVDQISLGKTEEKMHTYGFKFKGRTLTIHEIDCVDYDGDYCMKVKHGREVLRMVKVE